MSYNKILVPLDGTELAEHSLRHLSGLMCQGAHIHLVSVVASTADQMVSMAPDMWVRDDTRELEAREDYLKGVAESLRTQGFQVTMEVVPGRVVESLVHAAQDHCDLIVIASHRRHGLNRFILGSVAEGLLHQTHVPVLIV
jgi:nucleotide-binding universal stress UspA family protein